MKKIFFLLLLFFLCIVLTCVHAASPTYDDNPPPSYIWGSGGLNPQTSGTPNKNGEQTIDDSIHEVNVTVGSISVDTSNIENSTNAINGNVSDIKSDVSDIKTDISSISSNIGELITSQSSSDVTIASISVDTSNIESYLKTDVGSPGSPNIKNISELIASVFRAYDSNYNGGLTVQYLLSTINSTVNEIAYALGGNIGTDVGNIKNGTDTLVSNIATITESLNFKLRSDSYPYNVVASYTLAEMVYSIKQDVANVSNGGQPTVLDTRRITCNSNTSTQIYPLGGYLSPVEANQRVFIELRAVNPDDEFYVGFYPASTDADARPVKGRILLNIGAQQDIFIYNTNSSAIAIQQTEGWR